MKITTSSGYECEIDKARVTNDYRFTMAVVKGNSKDLAERVEADDMLIHLLLGNEQLEKLFAHVAESDGYIPRDKVGEIVAEIMTAIGKDDEIKN